jgi:ABC-type dipeptide/oligopeptide/nickel transport system permease subunit
VTTDPASVQSVPPSEKGVSLWRDAARRLRKDRVALLCLVVVLGYVVVATLAWLGTVVNDAHQQGRLGDGWKRFADTALFADFAVIDEPSEQQPPSSAHWFGTDHLGRDVLSRVAGGAAIAVRLGLAVGAVAVLIGAVLGAIAGWFGRVVDELVTWLYSTVASIPDIMLMVAIAYVWGSRGFAAMLMAMACTYWVGVARIVRAEFLKLRERDYVLAARAQGLSNARIMALHVAPNVAHLLIVCFTLLFVEAIKAEVVLSFLGIGFVSEPSWGILISDAENELMDGRWWQMTFTSAALFGIVLALQVFGDALRDALDPRLRQ